MANNIKQLKRLQAENRRLRKCLSVIANQDECFHYGKHIDCQGINGTTEEDRQFQSRLGDKLCPHCMARAAIKGLVFL